MGFLPAQNLVDVPLDGLQLLEPLFLFVIGVIQAVFLGDKLLDLGLQRFPGGQFISQKDSLYNGYREQKQRFKELQTVKRNIDQILRREEPNRRKEQNHER